MKIDQKYIVIGLIVITIFVLYYMNRHLKHELIHKKKEMEKFENENSSQYPKVVNFNASWCGWSKKLIPVWEQLNEYYRNKPIKLVDFKCDASEGNKQTCDNEGISGYPAILCYIGEDVYEFDGRQPRTAQNIASWIYNITGVE